MAEQRNPKPTRGSVSRRQLLISGGLVAVGTLAAASPRIVAAAAAPEIATSFKDFTLPKFQCDDSLAKIQQRGELRLCTSNDWPYSYLDPKSNEWTGIDADIIRNVTKMLKIPKIKVDTVPFDGMIPGLLDGRFDIVGDSIHYTKARAKVVDFCFPTYYYSEWLVVRKGNPLKAQKLADLKGKTCGALLGTNYAEWVQKAAGVTYVGYKEWLPMAQDIENGRLDSALHDQPIIAATMKDHPTWRLEMVSAYEPFQLKNPSGYSRFAFRQGDVQLRVGFDAAIEWLEDSEEMAKILTKWGLSGYNN
jgi:polar amino acid transport system substrate-binding protein